ncbi:hypothetical protein NON20_16885 [Synechocystis sp. B12]|nr:hypothetical protein NON20_16885 [Synechocystis sp. B12]
MAMVYALGLTLVGQWLYFQQKLPVPGGLLITIAVWMTPWPFTDCNRVLG